MRNGENSFLPMSIQLLDSKAPRGPLALNCAQVLKKAFMLVRAAKNSCLIQARSLTVAPVGLLSMHQSTTAQLLIFMTNHTEWTELKPSATAAKHTWDMSFLTDHPQARFGFVLMP